MQIERNLCMYNKNIIFISFKVAYSYFIISDVRYFKHFFKCIGNNNITYNNLAFKY